MSYIIGIDEVGRGPIAGPLVVCACAVTEGVDVLNFFPKGVLKDSKKLSSKHRQRIFEEITKYIHDKRILYGIGEVDATTIDTIGLSASIKTAVSVALKKIHDEGVSEESFIFLDGSLHTDSKYKQETIIKGDEKILEIALASIIAKVYRDTHMEKVGEEFPEYGFERHVGYGTALHYEAIKSHGITKYHRKSFLKNVVN